MAIQRLDGDVEITGSLRVSGTYTGPINRSNLIADNTAVYMLPLQDFRVWDAMHTNLPTVGAADDLGLATGAFGTALPYLKTQDLNAAGAVTEYARTMFTLPPEYVAGGTITLRLTGGMLTAVASVSATVDVRLYVSARDTLISGSDLSTTTPATSLNSLTFANADFVVTPTGRVAGDVLDIRIAWIGNSATASSHFGAIAHVEMLLQVKG
jgi:hypothetical protein